MVKTTESRSFNLHEDKPWLDWFWSHVDILDGFATDEDCWLWTGDKNTSGHGYFWVHYAKGHGRSIKHYAHVVSYRTYRGEIPEHLFVLHKCDSPSCVNPGHLFVDTKTINARDAAGKGRLIQKLSNEEVEKIISLAKEGKYSQQKIAKMFGINQSNVSRILNNQRREYRYFKASTGDEHQAPL